MNRYKIKAEEAFGVIDLGSYSIKVMIASFEEGGKLRILALEEYPSEGIEAGFITNIDKASRSVREAMERAQKTPGIKIEKVITVFSEKDIDYCIKNDIITFPRKKDYEVKESDIDRLWDKARGIKIEDTRALIHLLPISYSIDTRSDIKDPVGMTTNRLEGQFLMIKADKNNALNVIKCVQRAGFTPIDLIIQGIASSAILISRSEKNAGTALIQIGHGLTSVVVYKNGSIIHYSELPIAGNLITEDIQKVCELTNRADEVKKSIGVAFPELITQNDVYEIIDIEGTPPREVDLRTLSEIIYYRLEEIFEYVLVELDKAEMLNKLTAGIIVTGGQARMLGIKETAEQVTAANVRLGKPSINKVLGLNYKANDPAFSSVVGAAYYHANTKWFSPFLIENKKVKINTGNGTSGSSIFNKISKLINENFKDIIE